MLQTTTTPENKQQLLQALQKAKVSKVEVVEISTKEDLAILLERTKRLTNSGSRSATAVLIL